MTEKIYIVEVMPPHRAEQEAVCRYKAFDRQQDAEAFAVRQTYDAKAGRKTGYGCLIVEAEPPDDDTVEELEDTFERGTLMRWQP